MPDDEGNGRLSRIYPRAYIYIYTRNSTGHDDFLVQVQLSNTLGLYTFHRRRNLDDTENEPTVWLHIVAAYLCALHLLRHDVPASNNPVFNGNGLANRPPRYTHTHARTHGPLLFLVYFALVSLLPLLLLPRVTCFSFSIVRPLLLRSEAPFHARVLQLMSRVSVTRCES